MSDSTKKFIKRAFKGKVTEQLAKNGYRYYLRGRGTQKGVKYWSCVMADKCKARLIEKNGKFSPSRKGWGDTGGHLTHGQKSVNKVTVSLLQGGEVKKEAGTSPLTFDESSRDSDYSDDSEADDIRQESEEEVVPMMDGTGAGPPLRCIICLNYIKQKKRLVPQDSPEEQTMITYFLRKLAWTPVPEKDLKTFLKLGKPSEWAGFCYICEGEVKRCLEMHREVEKILNQISDVRKKLYENFFEVEGVDVVEDDARASCSGAKDVLFKKLRHQLFSDFKRNGQTTGIFDKSVMISYNHKCTNVEPTTPAKRGAVPQLEASECQDYSGTFGDDWDNHGTDNAGAGNEETPRTSTEYPSCSSGGVKLDVDGASPNEEPSSSTTPPKVEYVLSHKTGLLAVKKRRRQFDWELVQSFDTLDEARSQVKQEETWTLRSKRVLSDGTQFQYDCLRDRNCSAKIFLLIRESGSQVIVDRYSTNLPHDHKEPGRGLGLTEYEKSRVDRFYSDGITLPKKILEQLRMEGFDQPTLSQINAYISYNIRKKESPKQKPPPDPTKRKRIRIYPPTGRPRGRPPKNQPPEADININTLLTPDPDCTLNNFYQL